MALGTELLGESGVGQMELATLALQAADRLTSGALVFGPLRLLVPRWAGIGAHGAFLAAITVGCGDDVGVGVSSKPADVLDAAVAAETEVVECNGAVFRRELRAGHFAVREVTVEALAAAVRMGLGFR